MDNLVNLPNVNLRSNILENIPSAAPFMPSNDNGSVHQDNKSLKGYIDILDAIALQSIPDEDCVFVSEDGTEYFMVQDTDIHPEAWTDPDGPI